MRPASCPPGAGQPSPRRVAAAEDADLLGIASGTPLLVERRVIVDLRGRPLESTESRYPADRYALDVDFEVEGARDRAARGRDQGRAT